MESAKDHPHEASLYKPLDSSLSDAEGICIDEVFTSVIP
jgi:hypothetical protein